MGSISDIVEAKFYPIDDLAISVGHIYSFGRNAVTGEVEYLLPQFRGGNIAPSAFVSAAYGWNNSSNIMVGIRVYFGNHDKTLIRRQREDDPKSQTFGTQNIGALQNHSFYKIKGYDYGITYNCAKVCIDYPP